MRATAATLTISPDIYQVVSVDGEYESEYSNATRNRFIVRHFLGGEGHQSIDIEKYAPLGRYGTADRIIQSKDLKLVCAE